MIRPLRALAALAALTLAACAATPEGPGHWAPLPVERVYLAPLAMAPGAGAADPRVCDYARRDLQQDLVRTLPGRLAPVAFAGPSKPAMAGTGTATLRVTITRCRIESHQWDVGGGEPDITFYQTLGLRVQLTGATGDRLLDRQLQTVEQVQTDTPSAIFEFPHRVPAARISGLFTQGRFWRGDSGGQ